MNYDEMAQMKAREERTYKEARAMRQEPDIDSRIQEKPTASVGAGLIGAAMGPGFRWLLENRRQQHLREAAAIQVLLDSLPAKIPAEAEAALQDLLLRK